MQVGCRAQLSTAGGACMGLNGAGFQHSLNSFSAVGRGPPSTCRFPSGSIFWGLLRKVYFVTSLPAACIVPSLLLALQRCSSRT